VAARVSADNRRTRQPVGKSEHRFLVTAEPSNERRFVAFLRQSDGLRGNLALS
jgi:hypothetical protein